MSQLPVINENCPACYEAPKVGVAVCMWPGGGGTAEPRCVVVGVVGVVQERQRVKLLLAEQEHLHPALFSSLLQYVAALRCAASSLVGWVV